MASLETVLKDFAARLGFEIRITSSVKPIVTAIAAGSLNNRANLLRFPISLRDRLVSDEASNSLTLETAIETNPSILGSVSFSLDKLALPFCE
ncbi:unannotated protein [freshwater metagenome]|uniref:Unannotated protein n=1 Tax=freshwater metagenome TaxID=449393 RepID=A0A6J6XZ78_9ZZZZ